MGFGSDGRRPNTLKNDCRLRGPEANETQRQLGISALTRAHAVCAQQPEPIRRVRLLHNVAEDDPEGQAVEAGCVHQSLIHSPPDVLHHSASSAYRQTFGDCANTPGRFTLATVAFVAGSVVASSDIGRLARGTSSGG